MTGYTHKMLTHPPLAISFYYLSFNMWPVVNDACAFYFLGNGGSFTLCVPLFPENVCVRESSCAAAVWQRLSVKGHTVNSHVISFLYLFLFYGLGQLCLCLCMPSPYKNKKEKEMYGVSRFLPRNVISLTFRAPGNG
jgi:hypothetical protein